MNQGRIWCVVNPSVGLPLLLGGVAVISLGVHTAVLTSTHWMSNYWAGSSRTRTSLNTTTAPAAVASNTNAAFSVSVTPAADKSGTFVVTVTPKDPSAKPVAVAQSD